MHADSDCAELSDVVVARAQWFRMCVEGDGGQVARADTQRVCPQEGRSTDEQRQPSLLRAVGDERWGRSRVTGDMFLSKPVTSVAAVLCVCVCVLLPLQVAVMMVVEVLPVTVLLYPAAQAGLTLSIGKYGEVRLSGRRAFAASVAADAWLPPLCAHSRARGLPRLVKP